MALPIPTSVAVADSLRDALSTFRWEQRGGTIRVYVDSQPFMSFDLPEPGVVERFELLGSGGFRVHFTTGAWVDMSFGVGET